MIYLKLILITIALLFIFYLLGKFLNYICKNKDENNVIYGFILSLAIFEVIATPFMIFSLNFNILYYIYIIIILVIILISILKLNIKNEINKIYIFFKEKNMIKFIVITLILVLAIISSYSYFENADDAFYIGLTTDTINNNEMYKLDPSLGDTDSYFQSHYKLLGWQSYNSVISKTFDIHPAILAHTVLPFILVIIFFNSFFILISKIDKTKNKWYILGIFVLVILFSGISPKVLSISILLKCWQGKVLLPAIIFPLILSFIAEYKNIDKFKNIIILMLINVAAIALNPIALYMIPFIYFPLCLFLLFKFKIKCIMKYMITLLPVIVYGIIFVILAMLDVKDLSSTITELYAKDYFNILNTFIGNGIYLFILFGISVIYMLFSKNKVARFILGIMPIIYAFTIINPLFINLVSKYITTPFVYWRCFWLLPIELGIAYFIFDVAKKINNTKFKIVYLSIMLIIIISFGNIVYHKDNLFKKPENVYKIPNKIIEQTNYIISNSDKNTVVMAPTATLHSTTMRQLTNYITLFWSRDMHMNMPNNKLNKKSDIYKDTSREKLYSIYYDKFEYYDIDLFNYLIDLYNIDWLVINESELNKINYINKSNLKEKIRINNDILFRKEK